MEKSLQSEVSSLRCSDHKEAQICFICTAPDCKKRMICHKCLISDLDHNMTHSAKFKDLDTFFTEMKDVSQKDTSMAVMDNSYETIELRKKKISDKILYIQKTMKSDKLLMAAEGRKFIEKTLHYIETEFKKTLMLYDDNLERFLDQKLVNLKKYEMELENELLRMNVVSNRRNSKVALKKLSSSVIKSQSLKETIECMMFSAEGKSRSNEIIDIEIEKENMDPNFFKNLIKFLDDTLFVKIQEKTMDYINEVNLAMKNLGDEKLEVDTFEARSIEDLSKNHKNLKMNEFLVNFAVKGYDDKEAEKLNTFLSNSVIVDKIAMNFFDNKFTDNGIYKITQNLQRHLNIHTLEIWLGQNSFITNGAIGKLIPNLINCPRLRSLSLGISSNPKLNNALFSHIAKLLTSLNDLHTFSLYAAALPGISNEGIAEFAQSLAKAQNLRTLKLAIYENKQLNNQTARHLADALANLLKLEEFELYMYDTSITIEGRNLLDQVGATLPKISTYNLIYYD